MGTKAHASMVENAKEILESLSRVYADEWLSALQFSTASKLVRGITRCQVAETLNRHAKDELRHADMVAHRILQLGGELPVTPEALIRLANCAYIAPSEGSTAKIISQTITSERCAIAAYRKIIAETREQDEISYCMMLEILKDELDHEEVLQGFKEDLESLSEKIRASILRAQQPELNQ